MINCHYKKDKSGVTPNVGNPAINSLVGFLRFEIVFLKIPIILSAVDGWDSKHK